MVSLQAAVLALAVSGTGDTVLFDFYADWCGPCRQMDPTVRQLAAKGYPVRRVNVDQHRSLAADYHIGPIPCFVMVVDGKEVARQVGGTSLSRLEQMCRMAGTARPAARSPGALSLPIVQIGSPATPDALSGPKTPATSVSKGAAPPRGWQLAPATGTVPDTEAAKSEAHLLACTVRLRIADRDGHSCGSGTIIDAREGQALILTCGHIFRDSQGKGRIEVDLFGPGAAKKVPGRLLRYDDKRDVGLVSIRTAGPVAVARVAPPGYRVEKGDPVISVGCNHGADPTARPSRVAALDKYLGPPNLEIDDQPVEGRSGGGLFTTDGLLIGVCNAADPADHEGLFAALGGIQAYLEEAGLSFVYQDVPAMPRQMPQPAAQAAAPLEKIPTLPTASRVDADPSGRLEQLGPEERAALEEIRRRKSAGAEVICIIRPLRDPQAETEILVLNKASAALLERLAAEAGGGRLRQTSLAVPHPSKAAPAGGAGSPVRPAVRRTGVRLPSPIAEPGRQGLPALR